MKVLAIDTAAGACSVAVSDDQTIHERLAVMRTGHAEALLPLLLQVMDDASCNFTDLDLVGVTVGPGAFTGLRIGLATARGIALASGLPCIGVTTLETIAEAGDITALEELPLLIVLDSKRGDVYAQQFAGSAPAGPAEVATVEDLARRYRGQKLVVAGDAAAAMLTALRAEGVDAEYASGVPEYPTARRVAAIAARRWLGEIPPAIPPMPLYLRAPAIGPQSQNRKER